MNQTQAQGFLLAHAINDLLGRDPDPDFPGCCILRCGPCAALHWLRDHNREWADQAVIACYGRRCWDWQDRDGRIDWPQLTARWDAHKGCSSVNGVHEPCVAEDLEETAVGDLVAVTRPDGRVYRPRKGPRAVQLFNDDSFGGPYGWVLVLGTHDVDRAFALACAHFDGVDRSSAQLTWMRLAIRDNEPFYAADPVRGAATVRFEVTG